MLEDDCIEMEHEQLPPSSPRDSHVFDTCTSEVLSGCSETDIGEAALDRVRQAVRGRIICCGDSVARWDRLVGHGATASRGRPTGPATHADDREIGFLSCIGH